jgi:pimeloyl-ACP methyl ester carboxylesterase
MADYVLVHGAWGGAHTYADVPARLEAAGHRVVLVQLRGLGARQDELHPGIVLSDHMDDVCEQVEAAGFERFILVGHSYGGMVITGVATRLGGRIDAICYLDAFLPGDGESLWDITGPYERAWYIDRQKFNPGMVPMIGSENFLPVPGIIGFHPLLTLLEAVRFTGEEAKIPRRAYVFATDYQPTPFPRFAEKVKTDPAWEYHESKASHMVMADQTDQVVAILLGLAE